MIIFADHRTLVYTEISRQDYLVPKLGGTFNASEFEAHPERYRSVFADEVSVFLLVLQMLWAHSERCFCVCMDGVSFAMVLCYELRLQSHCLVVFSQGCPYVSCRDSQWA